jgi:hypothetical protein
MQTQEILGKETCHVDCKTIEVFIHDFGAMILLKVLQLDENNNIHIYTKWIKR